MGKGGKLEEYSGARTEKEIIEWVGKLQSTCAPSRTPSMFLSVQHLWHTDSIRKQSLRR